MALFTFLSMKKVKAKRLEWDWASRNDLVRSF